MKILLTGANGFVGRAMQAGFPGSVEVITTGRDSNCMVVCDLATDVPVIPPVDMVVHAAGKAHMIPKTATEKEDFFKVNVQGTKNLLTALDKQALRKFIYISTVAVYGLSAGSNISEKTPLLATEPYGNSKIEAEKLVIDWCTKKGVEFYILRLPLVAGKSAPGNLGAMVKGIRSGKYLSIGKAAARKSMILASDLPNFIATLQGPSGVYNLTDGYHPCFGELENMIALFHRKKKVISIPLIAAKMIAFAGDAIGPNFPINTNKLKKLTATLTFDDSRARSYLRWNPNEVLKCWEIG